MVLGHCECGFCCLMFFWCIFLFGFSFYPHLELVAIFCQLQSCMFVQSTLVMPLFVMWKLYENSIRSFGVHRNKHDSIFNGLVCVCVLCCTSTWLWMGLQKAYILRFIFHPFLRLSLYLPACLPFFRLVFRLLFVIYSKHEQTFCDCDNFSRFSLLIFMWERSGQPNQELESLCSKHCTIRLDRV